MTMPRTMLFEALETRRLLAFNPTADEQELLQLVNRFRTDPKGEFSRLISTASPIRARDPILQADLDFAKVDGNVLRNQLQAMTPVPPVAWNEAVVNFAKGHNAKMLAANPPRQFHSVTLERRQALLDAGVNLRFAQGERINSENVYGYGKSPLHTYAAWVIDWQQGGPSGMQAELGHRLAIANPDFEQVGHAITTYAGSNFGPQVTTQVLVNIANPPVMVVGAVFEDRNKSTWYEAGEGLGNVQIVFEGAAGTFTTRSLAAGGYQLELPPGTYKATASGGGMKHAVINKGIKVGAENVWRNLIYDPELIPPDAQEPNNTLSTATVLSGAPQTLPGLSIHVPSDVDYFRLDALGTGPATFTIQFSHAAGNLDLRLLNATGIEIARSATNNNSETVSVNLTRGSTVYAQVAGSGGAKNGSYTLTVNPPSPVPPIAEPDRSLVTSQTPHLTIPLLANDRNPDGEPALLVPILMPGSPPAFTLSGKLLNYTAPAGYSGVHRASYTVRNEHGQTSAPAAIEIFVLNFELDYAWHNSKRAADVNDDGQVTPLDVLLIVNEINLRNARRLPTNPREAAGMFGFVDSSGDGFLSALDVLLVVNTLNKGGVGVEGEPKSADFAARARARDEVFEQWVAVDTYEIAVSERRKFRQHFPS